jgi:uncharacterized protein YbbC (DUF1343 family)
MEIGLDRLAAEHVRGKSLALLAHPASVDRGLRHVGDVLESLGARPRIIFGPEHGYGGEAQDMIGVKDAKDARGTPVKSLYGANFADLAPTEEHLDGVELLVVDLQDVGARYYTFVWTAVLALRVCAKRGVGVLVLDRPNPLGGAEIEGRLQAPGFLSFVGLEPVPIRHGLTLGEIVAWRASLEGSSALLRVLGVTGLDRAAHAPAWDRPMVMPSPNMPTYETALVYPGGCLLEGTNLSDGRGTTRPFEITGAPWLDGARLAKDLADMGGALPGVTFRPLTFRPTFHKHAGQVCGGVQVHVTAARSFRPVATYVALLALAQRQAPDAFEFRTERYEFVDDIPALDLLTGSAAVRTQMLAGEAPARIAESASAIGDAERAMVRAAREAAASVTM